LITSLSCRPATSNEISHISQPPQCFALATPALAPRRHFEVFHCRFDAATASRSFAAQASQRYASRCRYISATTPVDPSMPLMFQIFADVFLADSISEEPFRLPLSPQPLSFIFMISSSSADAFFLAAFRRFFAR